MTVYLDTSAFVKLYVDENGSQKVRSVISKANSLAISEIGLVESYSALFRKALHEGYQLRHLERIINDLERDWLALGRIHLNDPVIAETKKIIKKYFLRSYDAIHLASALILSKALGKRIGFLCFDNKLNEVAKKFRKLKVL